MALWGERSGRTPVPSERSQRGPLSSIAVRLKGGLAARSPEPSSILHLFFEIRFLLEIVPGRDSGRACSNTRQEAR